MTAQVTATEAQATTATTFFGFALADSMFAGDCTIARKSLTAEQAKEIISAGVEPCLNPSHQATITAMNSRFDIHVEIPQTAPQVKLTAGDSLLVMGVRVISLNKWHFLPFKSAFLVLYYLK